MNQQVVQINCPGCARPLRIPATMIGQSMRCKHCGHIFQTNAKPKPATPPTSPLVAGTTSPPGTNKNPVAPSPAPRQTAAPAPKPKVAPLPEVEELPNFVPHPLHQLNPEVTPPPEPVLDEVAPKSGNGYVSAYGRTSKYVGKGNYRRPEDKRGWVKWVVISMIFLTLGGGAGWLFYTKPPFVKEILGEKPAVVENNNNNPGEKGTPGEGNTATKGNPVNGTGTPVASSGDYPRRILSISVNNYFNMTPIHPGEFRVTRETDRRDVHAAITKIAERWRVDKSQIYEISDTPTTDLKKQDSKHPPFQDVIQKTVELFSRSSRAQDRIVVLFCGHVVEKDGLVFLVPLEGDPEEPDTLLPLAWFYQELDKCKAQEKLVIFDVCRFDPGRGMEKTNGGGPMSESIEKALHESPDGVSVWTACSAGQNSYEYDYAVVNPRQIWGSIFLSQIFEASTKGKLASNSNKKLQSPSDPLPLEALTEFINQETIRFVKDYQIRMEDKVLEQTPKYTNKKKETMVAYSAAEPLPSRFPYPSPPPGADPKLVAALIKEINIPSVKATRVDTSESPLSETIPFRAEALDPYQTDGKRVDDVPFRKAIVEAVAEMQKLRGGGSSELPEEFRGQTNDAAKAQIKRTQEIPARIEAILSEHMEKLESLAPEREKEIKRWQAHYDYVLAQLKIRVAYVNEYNLALARVRGDKDLPELKPGQTGYRLAANPKMLTDKQHRDYAESGRELLTTLIKDHPNTPWALLAKREKSIALGLVWMGSDFAGGTR